MILETGYTFDTVDGKATITNSYMKSVKSGNRYYRVEWENGDVREISHSILTSKPLERFRSKKRFTWKPNNTRIDRNAQKLVGTRHETVRHGWVKIVAYHGVKDVEVEFEETGVRVRGKRLERVLGGNVTPKGGKYA
ncbi:hypothetical protein M316_0052 [Nitrincola phage 1M3-16]|uniref:hypothetical protein n=1 Tax=Nitrincola phage 1M3-16 TaxID=1472912 RepID=UPI000444C391|nr:hypothetical protein GJ22_gp100 [Nitrincola phage 1M3-16]AHX01117.1 hypothetical protein M316_0052 [Nitrincola phage 1M3-16]